MTPELRYAIKYEIIPPEYILAVEQGRLTLLGEPYRRIEHGQTHWYARCRICGHVLNVELWLAVFGTKPECCSRCRSPLNARQEDFARLSRSWKARKPGRSPRRPWKRKNPAGRHRRGSF